MFSCFMLIVSVGCMSAKSVIIFSFKSYAGREKLMPLEAVAGAKIRQKDF